MTPLRACCLFVKPLALGQNSTLQVKSQWRLAYRLQILALTKPVGHHKFIVPPGRREDLLFANLMVWEVPMGHYNARSNAKSSELSLRTDSFKRKEPDSPTESDGNNPRSPKNSIMSDGPKTGLMLLERVRSFKSFVVQEKVPNGIKHPALAALSLPSPFRFCLLRPGDELDAAAIKLQKFYKSYQTRRNLADCAVVIEELWWKALDFAALKKSSVSFFDGEKHETAVDRWTRARTKAAKVGKGLSKDGKAQKLALQHWLEAIDPRHRYGHNLHLYYDVWFRSESTQPFFYWLDVGDGKEVNLEKCPRSKLQRQCIKYLGPKEREAYEVIIESGRLVYKKNKELVETTEDSKWIFVLSTSRALYVGRKRKGEFQHSSFLSGGATTAAGRLVAHSGLLQAIWPYSGHYHPTEQNFKDFISFLEENQVDLTNVKRYSYSDTSLDNGKTSPKKSPGSLTFMHGVSSVTDDLDYAEADHQLEQADDQPEAQHSKMTQQLARKWTTGAGPRIKCVREYPVDLQSQALERVNLSPRVTQGSYTSRGPIPSPRRSPKHLLSPRFSCMGLPSP